MGISFSGLLTLVLLISLKLKLTSGRNFFQTKIAMYLTHSKCHDAALNCTSHWDMVPFIAPVGLCDEYFPIECMTELVMSSHCKDEPGYGAFLMSIGVEVEDCVKSGMKWTAVFLKRLIRKAVSHILCHKIQKVCYNVTSWNPNNATCDLDFAKCIMDTYAEEYCREFEDDLELAFYGCLSGATRCENKEEMITACEKEYLNAIRRSIAKIDRERGFVEKNETYRSSLKEVLMKNLNPLGLHH